MYIEKLKEKFEAIEYVKDKVENLRWDSYCCLYEATDWKNADQVADMHWINGAWTIYRDLREK